MRIFRDLPIRRKLLLIILATIATSLLLAMAGIVVWEIFTYRGRLAAEMSAVADFVAANSAASLAFDDRDTARATLKMLAAYPEVNMSVLYTQAGEAFTFYAPGKRLIVVPEVRPEGVRFVGRRLEIYRPVEQKGRRLGTLYLAADAAPLATRLAPYAGILLLTALAIGGGALILQRLLQRLISERLVRLSRMAESVAAGDLSARAPVESADEIGQLADAFNRMTTQLAQSYAVLATREREYRSLAENSPEVIARFDRQLRHLYVNEHGARVYGVAKEEIIGRTNADIGMPADKVAFWQEQFEAVFASGEQRTVDFDFASPTYGQQFFSSLFVPEFDEAGEVASILAITRDVTALKRSESELRRLKDELEVRVERRTAELTAANEEMEAFTYTVSHDLRAPLRHITGFIALLKEDAGPNLDEKSLRYVRIIADAGRRMGNLIDDLLAFSRIGRMSLNARKVDLRQMVDEVRAELAPETHGRTIEWKIGDLPDVTADPVLLRSVLANLLANAVKYTRRRAQATIEVGGRQEGDEVIISVRDNGAGFDMRYADKLFGVFQRLHPERQFEGTGIGLASVRRVIVRHGGRVWAEGEEEKGATFYFSLPVR